MHTPCLCCCAVVRMGLACTNLSFAPTPLLLQMQPDHDTAEHGAPYSGGDNVFVRLDPGLQKPS